MRHLFRMEKKSMKKLHLFGGTPHPFDASRIALGCDHYGADIPRGNALAVMDAYFAAGGNVFDTAHIYSQPGEGKVSESEKLVGEWLRANGCRDTILLVTKGAHPGRDDMTKSRLNPEAVRGDLDLSLETLGVDAVDVWFAHRDNPAAPAAEIMDMLIETTKGRVRHLGASNWTGARLAEANAHAAKKGHPGFAISQIQWSLARVTKASWGDDTVVIMDEAELGWYARSGMPVMAFSSQAKGLFSKAIEQGEAALPEKTARRFQVVANRDRIARCRIVSERTGVNPAGICLAYITSAPFPALPIVGTGRPEQLADSLRFADFDLTAEDRAFLAGD